MVLGIGPGPVGDSEMVFVELIKRLLSRALEGLAVVRSGEHTNPRKEQAIPLLCGSVCQTESSGALPKDSLLTAEVL
jgi:hypothetical protein